MAANLATLTGLLERVRSTTEPDRALDARICRALAIEPWTGWRAPQPVWFASGSVLDRDTPRLTSSIDAAVSAVNAAIPDACISLSINEAYEGHRLHTAFVRPQGEDEASAFFCATPALAVCAGLLVTLIALARTQEADHGA